MNGFQLAKYMNAFGNPLLAVLVYLVFLSALAGCIIGVLLLAGKNIKLSYDLICFFTCATCGLIVFLLSLNSKESKLQSGAYFILFGWIVAFIGQIKYKNNKSEYNLQDIFTGFVSKLNKIDTSNKSYCTQCGSKLANGSKFCSNCGAKIQY
jgi:predicted RNA-binding Zn-ribbon protein involved in translation (DUF1610 family)